MVRRIQIQEQTAGGPLQPQEVSALCGEGIHGTERGSIKRTHTSFTLEDLKLPDDKKELLLQICAHVKYRHLVYDTWQMESRYPYGRNVSALFVGPPGTGKTMAVHALANRLDMPLYTVDLSQVVDKYIGETEKKLEEIFTTAEKNNVILFFDEADSIFSKRSEVADAKDKYANTEVSYILQRVERYDGIVFLASNYRQNIDDAFLRRIRYLVEFQLPDEATRREIWESSFTPTVPQDDLDFAYLARQFPMSGGFIKNAVLNAVFMAAAEDSEVNMHHVLQSLRIEYMKQGRSLTRDELGAYSSFL